MSEMIERVAKAIDTVLGDDHESLSIEMGCGSLSKEMRAEAMAKAARAAIEAMREPTDAMVDIDSIIMLPTKKNYRIWQAMIDEALK
jgi:hypothetical protein